MSSIQSPVIPSSPPTSAPAGTPPTGDDACPDQDHAFAQVLRDKQNPPRKEVPGVRAPATPSGAEADTATAETAGPGVDTSTLPPELAAVLAQIGVQAAGHGRAAADAKRAGEAGTPARRMAGSDDPAQALSRYDDAAARSALAGAPVAAAPAADPRHAVAGEPAAPGARLTRADGVVARPAASFTVPQLDPASAPRFESALERASVERASSLRATAGVESAAAPAAPVGWAAAAIPADGAVMRPPAAPQHVATVDAPVGSQRFADQTAQQVTWMAKNGLSEAEIRVKPAELGPISVRIEMNQNEAVINFAVTQPETRAAVQDSLHRLQEMLAESGISLGEANVGGQDQGQASQFGARPGSGTRNRVTFPGAGDGAGALPAVPRGLASARGLVDTFA